MLAAGNVRKLKTNLASVIDAAAIAAIESEICANAAQLYKLGKSQYLFARRLSNRYWRQKVSRLYYAAYNAGRAVRLCLNGEYSTDSSDHKKVDAIPADFPNNNTYANRLRTLREDRNLCDYDHSIGYRDLVINADDALVLVEEFLEDAESYLRAHGVPM